MKTSFRSVENLKISNLLFEFRFKKFFIKHGSFAGNDFNVFVMNHLKSFAYRREIQNFTTQSGNISLTTPKLPFTSLNFKENLCRKFFVNLINNLG